MSNTPHPETQALPTDRRLFLLPNGPQSLVVRGHYLAEPLSEQLMTTMFQVDSLEHAHEVLLAIYRLIWPSACKIVDVSDTVFDEFGPYVHLHVVTEEGEELYDYVVDPGQIEAIKAAGLWP